MDVERPLFNKPSNDLSQIVKRVWLSEYSSVHKWSVSIRSINGNASLNAGCFLFLIYLYYFSNTRHLFNVLVLATLLLGHRNDPFLIQFSI